MKWINGHVTIGPVTQYFDNAMHFATNISTPWGYLCFRPTTRRRGMLRRWYVYMSRDATPCDRSWGIGPGLRE